LKTSVNTFYFIYISTQTYTAENSR